MYAELHSLSNFSFLRGASHPQELVYRAHALDYRAIALTDECSLAGIVKAYQAAQDCGIKLICGSEFRLSNNEKLVVLAPTRRAYAELSGFITLARRRAEKGRYLAELDDLRFRLQHCLILWIADFELLLGGIQSRRSVAKQFSEVFKHRLYLALNHQFLAAEKRRFAYWRKLADEYSIPMIACGSVVMHEAERKPLVDVLLALKEKQSVQKLGARLQSNAEAYLKPLSEIVSLYPAELIEQTAHIANMCTFSLNELKYQYPLELVPGNTRPIVYLRRLVEEGARQRWPEGVPANVVTLLEKELQLIEELSYEYYFLTVFDIVKFARAKGILCQGRGSAANSVVCYCLMITEISPGLINVLFERFISKERDEPPDIDVDFEHSRREEVMQYIYQKYGRERAALAASVVTYRPRSAIRDVGRALGLDAELIDYLAKSLAWWDRKSDLQNRMQEAGMQGDKHLMNLFYQLVQLIQGFPRHLSQHVGGFVITQDKISDIVPVENASMAERTVIQWDKDDLEYMGLMKVDVLALGMLTAIRKALADISGYDPTIRSLSDIPREDAATYDMLCRADSVGVFQVESRAQMSMLPRLKPRRFYDLVIQIAIVRPGPIQGGMVHPYLKRRDGLEQLHYENDALREVLEPTLGVPIFQEQVIRLSMVAAGFSGGEADQLRRAMASWGKNGNLLQFEQKFLQGMLANGYSEDFAERLFEQVKGFGGYGFPESHSASFAILCYISSWLKCHHPAAFYCALLNSQPMGFYSPSQLIQDARRHHVAVFPVDIQHSRYESTLENTVPGASVPVWGIRLGFIQVKGLDQEKAKNIAVARADRPFESAEDILRRTSLSPADLQVLASADVLHGLLGHRYRSRWQVAGVEIDKPLLRENTPGTDSLVIQAPSLQKDIASDLQTTRVSLRPHIMSVLRRDTPFIACKRQSELASLSHKSFVKVAGLVTGRQRPGTANGTVFLTLEDETGNINVIVWKRTQELFRKALLNGRLLLIKGNIETDGSVVHVVAGQLHDYSDRLDQLAIRSRDFH
jgi:error-prone DNA polymerase